MGERYNNREQIANSEQIINQARRLMDKFTRLHDVVEAYIIASTVSSKEKAYLAPEELRRAKNNLFVGREKLFKEIKDANYANADALQSVLAGYEELLSECSQVARKYGAVS